MRSTDEWIGKTDDDPIPPRVRVRVFERFGGVCQLSKRKIHAGEPWDVDHVKALILGGEHRERNLQPVLRDKHREKTAGEVAIKSKIARVKAKHRGVWPEPKRKLQSRGFQKREPAL
jgi:5-methylcytosine-specific restriction protein A